VGQNHRTAQQVAQTVALYRQVTGAALPFPAANRDPEAFPEADQVVLDRAENRHAAFGLGIHRCAGSNLARMELRVALQVWMQRHPDFELADPAAVVWAGGQVRGPRLLPLHIL
jgi:cytochrome P450